MTTMILDHLPLAVSNGHTYRIFTSVVVLVAATVSAFGQDRPKDGLRLLFTGDILLSRGVDVELKARIRPPWAGLQHLFHSADWVGGNFEGAIGRPEQCISRKSACFATADSATHLLMRAGFRTLTIENNHAGDLGGPGREQSGKAFQQAGLAAIDFERSPQFFPLDGAVIALIAVTMIPAVDGKVQQIPSAELRDKLRAAKLRANVVLVSIHWGNELIQWPSATQRKAAAWLVGQGADLVVGHHPHVIQRPECVAGRPVFFSLGNHVFDQANPKTKEGMIADCRVSRGRLRCKGLRTHTAPGTSFPVLTGRDRISDTALAACVTEIRASHIH